MCTAPKWGCVRLTHCGKQRLPAAVSEIEKNCRGREEGGSGWSWRAQWPAGSSLGGRGELQPRGSYSVGCLQYEGALLGVPSRGCRHPKSPAHTLENEHGWQLPESGVDTASTWTSQQVQGGNPSCRQETELRRHCSSGELCWQQPGRCYCWWNDL